MVIISQPKQGDRLDAGSTPVESQLEILTAFIKKTEANATTYGYVLSGRAEVKAAGFCFDGNAGTFFCIPGPFEMDATGIVVAIRRACYKGLLSAGRLESTGRLAYLNGCSSTVLIPPPKLGDPVLNHLHIPYGVDQIEHTHPSIRLGVVVRGAGIARGRDLELNDWQKPLFEGCVFFLSAGELHGFSTMADQCGLDLVTYHPDSEWGPSDDDHPMLSSTVFENRAS
jgi:hypothetical protein